MMMRMQVKLTFYNEGWQYRSFSHHFSFDEKVI
jgi:hypothetical protein